jgi:ribosomal protein L22
VIKNHSGMSAYRIACKVAGKEAEKNEQILAAVEQLAVNSQ